MAEIAIHGLTREFVTEHGTAGVRELSIVVPDGEMLVLLGPSGCGKTTTLRCVAGLEKPDRGTIEIGGRVVYDDRTDIPTSKRDVGLVFQSFALWPHMTAAANIAYPLRARRIPRREVASRVSEVAKLLDLSEAMLSRRPAKLSGGQQQRVALARAIVAESQVVLFDEPLSNLDALLREQLRTELRTLHRRLGFTGIYVTHDLAEALAIGDQIAVMRDGNLVQVGSADDVFNHPADTGVAKLVGFTCFTTSASDAGGPADVDVYVRAADVGLRRDRAGGDSFATSGLIVSSVRLGGRVDYLVDVDGRRFRVSERAELNEATFEEGQPVELFADERGVVLFHRVSGERIDPLPKVRAVTAP